MNNHAENLTIDGLEGEVYTDELSRTLLSTDAGIYQISPAAVVYPKNTEDVVKVVRYVAEHDCCLHPRGAGSGLCGSAVGRGIVIDFTKYMNRLIAFDPDEKFFTCEPGYRYGELEELLADSELFFPPAPSSGEYATFGGMYSTNAGGAYSVKYGNVADYAADAEIVLANGDVWWLSDLYSKDIEELPAAFKELFSTLRADRDIIKDAYPNVPCNVCGYELRYTDSGGKLNLLKLLGGSEGTLAIVTRLTFRLVNKPKFSALIIAYFHDIVSTAKAAQMLLLREPAGIEIMDKSLINTAFEFKPSLKGEILDGYDNLLMINFESNNAQRLERLALECKEEIAPLTGAIFTAVSEEETEKYWTVRKAAVPILYLLKGNKKILPLVEDAAIPTDRLVEYFNGLYKIFNDFGVRFVLYGHIAKGLLHSRPILDLKDRHDISLIIPIADTVFNLIMKLGGTVSGEHGDGRLRSKYVPLQYQNIYSIFVKVKNLFDPDNRLNPGIITGFEPNGQINNLRYGEAYSAKELAEKHLMWEDGFINEVEKCHGCSKCTTVSTAVRMCPIYKITRDETAAPKAKANMLRALISGKIGIEKLYTGVFQYVLNRCINCGSCHSECPSKVNIPKLALEAKAGYIKRYGLDFSKRFSVKLEEFGRNTHRYSPIYSAALKINGIRKAFEKITGLTAERTPPAFAFRSLYDRFDTVIGSQEKSVIFFAGCYASYIRPEIGESAIRLLNEFGYKVILPEQHCCGIPHSSKGLAEDVLAKIGSNFKSWAGRLEEAEYIVTTCSSCTHSLQNAWGDHMGGELIDRIRKMTVPVTSLINMHNPSITSATAISLAYHTPCHMKLSKDSLASYRLLSKAGNTRVSPLVNSCCGMAGSWGSLKENYVQSAEIGELLATSLEMSDCEICATDCPTCEMQLKHLTRTAIFHPIEVIDKILH
ncbi:MAG: FAD-binding oxidoreductase [Deferribacteraceae bacterium]|jgi:FAD/FMN-containing dehydrogenase/Fe-S oxidoreductase|nr:FAD-binding oxidoreductase [Deferribacteraceae bacterium]